MPVRLRRRSGAVGWRRTNSGLAGFEAAGVKSQDGEERIVVTLIDRIYEGSHCWIGTALIAAIYASLKAS
jgi:hypothetical protein